MSNNCTQETRLENLEKAQVGNNKLLLEIREALLGNAEWKQTGLVERLNTIELQVQSLLEVKNRAWWLVISLGAIASAAFTFFTWAYDQIKHLFIQ